jgi:hypothetical protein
MTALTCFSAAAFKNARLAVVPSNTFPTLVELGTCTPLTQYGSSTSLIRKSELQHAESSVWVIIVSFGSCKQFAAVRYNNQACLRMS